MRLAAAPISWGVCEVPGWGYQLGLDRVLTQMRELGITATEFGPPGFLPAAPQQKAEVLARYDLRAVGGFVPVVLHAADPDPHAADPDPHAVIDDAIDGLLAAGADRLVLAAATGGKDYDARVELDQQAWRRLLAQLDEVAVHAAERGVQASLHPHVGTVIERREDVERVLAGSTIGLCLDTGHLLVGGTDPVALAHEAADRVAHVHLKDVDAGLASAVLAGERVYGDAVRDGLFRPLGDGDVAVAELIRALNRVGYAGWYVLEQDVMLDAEPGIHQGPRADVARSISYVETVASELVAE